MVCATESVATTSTMLVLQYLYERTHLETETTLYYKAGNVVTTARYRVPKAAYRCQHVVVVDEEHAGRAAAQSGVDKALEAGRGEHRILVDLQLESSARRGTACKVAQRVQFNGRELGV